MPLMHLFKTPTTVKAASDGYARVVFYHYSGHLSPSYATLRLRHGWDGRSTACLLHQDSRHGFPMHACLGTPVNHPTSPNAYVLIDIWDVSVESLLRTLCYYYEASERLFSPYARIALGNGTQGLKRHYHSSTGPLPGSGIPVPVSTSRKSREKRKPALARHDNKHTGHTSFSA